MNVKEKKKDNAMNTINIDPVAFAAAVKNAVKVEGKKTIKVVFEDGTSYETTFSAAPSDSFIRDQMFPVGKEIINNSTGRYSKVKSVKIL